MCCKYGMTDGSIGRSPPSLIRAKQSCMRHHASVLLRVGLQVRRTCMLWLLVCCLCVRVCPSVCTKCQTCACSPSGLLITRSPWIRQFGGGALACLSAHHQPQLQRCQHTRTETLLFDLCRASHVSAAHFDWQRLERMDGGAQR